MLVKYCAKKVSRLHHEQRPLTEEGRYSRDRKELSYAEQESCTPNTLWVERYLTLILMKFLTMYCERQLDLNLIEDQLAIFLVLLHT